MSRNPSRRRDGSRPRAAGVDAVLAVSAAGVTFCGVAGAVRLSRGGEQGGRRQRKRQTMLRNFAQDAYAMTMLVLMQRRVRRWCATNALFLTNYEEHRRMLGLTLAAPSRPAAFTPSGVANIASSSALRRDSSASVRSYAPSLACET